jgi:hypothetical protein
MVEFTGLSQDKYRGYRMLSYAWYKEYYSKFYKHALISAFEDVNNLTVFTLNRNSLNHDVLSLRSQLPTVIQKH